MKQTLEEAVNEIGGVHPDWDKITCFRIGFKEEPDGKQNNLRGYQ